MSMTMPAAAQPILSPDVVLDTPSMLVDETLMEPAYYSDNLLCLEARARGMRLREVRIGLRHKENVTAGPSRDPVVAEATRLNRDRYVARVRELLVTA